MEHKQHSSVQGSNGFLFGLVVGILITLFLVTKKGRTLLKKLGDEGLDVFEEIEAILQNAENTGEKEGRQQKEILIDKTQNIKELVVHTVEEKLPEIKEKVDEIKKVTEANLVEIPVTHIDKKIDEVKDIALEITKALPLDDIKQKLNNIQELPVVKEVEKKVEERVETTIEEIVEKMETTQTELQEVKESLQEVLHAEKPKSVARRFFKGIRKK